MTAEQMLSAEAGVDFGDAEVVFDFLGTTVRAASANIEQLQHWCAVYGEFRVPARPADITVSVHEPRPSDRPRAATIEAAGRMRMWNGREPLLPPLREPGLSQYLYVQGIATGRLGHAVLVLGSDAQTRTAVSLSCSARGAAFFGCDVVPVDLEDLLAMPWPKALALDPDALSVLGINGSHPGLMPFLTRGGELLFRALPSDVLGRRMCRVATDIAAVVVLTEDAGASLPRLQDLPEREAFECLLRHLAVRPRDGEQVADAMVRLCRRVPAYSLTMGPLAATAGLIDQLLF